jgi:hypothetical protein
MIGSCDCCDRWNAPFLNGSKLGFVVFDRVPSGKINRFSCPISSPNPKHGKNPRFSLDGTYIYIFVAF